MNAAIDIGSNSIRLLIGDVLLGVVNPFLYQRKITRLAGGSGGGQRTLSSDSMEKSLSALESFVALTAKYRCHSIRAVATEALRQADNATEFVHLVHLRTGLQVEIIDGTEEASLSATGARSALSPLPQNYLLFDVGGGSTEFILQQGGSTSFHKSYPLGVISLAESFPEAASRVERVEQAIDTVCSELFQLDLLSLARADQTALVGTAGTVTTLAAIKLQMTDYDWRRVNNLQLDGPYLLSLQQILSSLSPLEREALPGMEAGRGDLILPGLEIVLRIMRAFNKTELMVSDFGLLEGILLSL